MSSYYAVPPSPAQAPASAKMAASVNVRLGGGGEGLFTKSPQKVSQADGVLYVEVNLSQRENGKQSSTMKRTRVISVATIQSALGNSFEITGLSSQDEARTLALLLARCITHHHHYRRTRSRPKFRKTKHPYGYFVRPVGFSLVVVFMALITASWLILTWRWR